MPLFRLRPDHCGVENHFWLAFLLVLLVPVGWIMAVRHYHAHWAMTIATGLVVTCGASIGSVAVWDDYAGLSRGELKNRLAMGATESENSEALDDLVEHAPRGAEISYRPGQIVEQQDCAPRPCTLSDFGVPLGQRYTTVYVFNKEQFNDWVCTEEYVAWIVFDDDGKYYRVEFDDRPTCL